MKRVFLALAVAALLAPAAQLVFGKAHVPGHKVQVCHRGSTITVGSSALGGHSGHGDGQLPACDFNNVFHTGDDCPTGVDAEGKASPLGLAQATDQPSPGPVTYV